MPLPLSLSLGVNGPSVGVSPELYRPMLSIKSRQVMFLSKTTALFFQINLTHTLPHLIEEEES